MQKRLFQILDDMNVSDEENNTKHLQVMTSFVSANLAKGGGHVTIGVPAEVIHRLAFEDSCITVLLVIDKKEYDKLTTIKKT